MLRNKLIDELKLNNRSHQIDQLLFSADACIERDAEYNQICTEDENSRNSTLMSALDHLSDYQKEAMFLKFTNGFNYEQISAILGISIAFCQDSYLSYNQTIKTFIDRKVVNRIYYFSEELFISGFDF